LIVLDHPACDQEVKNQAEPLCIELEAQLTGQQVDMALRRARAKSLEAVVDEVLEQE
jgi:hypothetical protein